MEIKVSVGISADPRAGKLRSMFCESASTGDHAKPDLDEFNRLLDSLAQEAFQSGRHYEKLVSHS